MQDALKAEVAISLYEAVVMDAPATTLTSVEEVAEYIVDRLRRGGISDAVIRNVLCDVDKEKAAS